MYTHIFWTYFWNWSIDGRNKWLFKMFPNKVCMSFDNDKPLTAKDLWENRNGLLNS